MGKNLKWTEATASHPLPLFTLTHDERPKVASKNLSSEFASSTRGM
jgi:hypothetical protein